MSVLDMIKEFRRNWRALCSSERTTLCGPDSMLLALQLSMAENNKQVSRLYLVQLLKPEFYSLPVLISLSLSTSLSLQYLPSCNRLFQKNDLLNYFMCII